MIQLIMKDVNVPIQNFNYIIVRRAQQMCLIVISQRMVGKKFTHVKVNDSEDSVL